MGSDAFQPSQKQKWIDSTCATKFDPFEYIDATKPISAFRDFARFLRKTAGIGALTAFAANRRIADSRRITQFECPKLSESRCPARRVRALVLARPVQLDLQQSVKERAVPL
jgi:hypothetical protein